MSFPLDASEHQWIGLKLCSFTAAGVTEGDTPGGEQPHHEEGDEEGTNV